MSYFHVTHLRLRLCYTPVDVIPIVLVFFLLQNLQAPEDLVEGAVGGESNTQEELKRLRQQLQDTRSQLQGIQGLFIDLLIQYLCRNNGYIYSFILQSTSPFIHQCMLFIMLVAYGVNSNPSVMNQMMAQLQQQQLLLYQQMLSQQQENAERLRRLEQTVLRSDQTDFQANPYMSPYSHSPLLQPLSVASNTLLSAGRPDANTLLATAGGRNTESNTVPTVRPFQFQPRPFTGVNNANSSAGAYNGLIDVPQQLTANNLYSTGSNNRDPGLNEVAQNITVTVNNTASPAERLVQQRQQVSRAAAARSNLNTQSDRSHLYRVEDVVPIETIQASDQRIPPLNLNRVLANNRSR